MMKSCCSLQSAVLLLHLLLCFASVFSNAKPFLSVPVSKQPLTGRFVAKIFHGTDPNRQATDLVLDLGGPVTRLPCRRSSQSTHRYVSCPSLQCSKAGGSAEITRLGDQLAEDVVAVGSVDSVHSTVDRFLFHCSSNSAVLGLGRSRMSLPSQFSMTHFLDRRFSLCLSASGEDSRLLIGDALAGTDISKTLIYTPLLTDSESQSNPTHHVIPVKSIKIGSVNPDVVKVNGRARLSTTAPFTSLKYSVYQTFVKKFVKAVQTSSSNSNVTVVTDQSAWAPFKTCFVVGSSNVVFPEVDLVLQSEVVKWRIGGGNLMVVVDKEKGVTCLGILDGGSEDEDEIVIGRNQLVGIVMEFDMGRSMMGFGSTTSCAELKLLDSRSTGLRQSQSSTY